MSRAPPGCVSVPVRAAAAWSWGRIAILAAVGLFGYMSSTITVDLIPVLVAGLLVVAGRQIVLDGLLNISTGSVNDWVNDFGTTI